MTTEPRHAYGWARDLPDARDLKFDHHFAAAQLGLTSFPPVVDLRPQMPPVYDQGQLGSCTANAIAGAIEYEQKKQGLAEFAPSRLMIYYDERVIEHTVRSDAGAQIRDGMKTVAAKGVCNEVLWPYNIAEFEKKPPATAYTAAKAHRVTQYLSVQQSEVALKTCLASGYPVVGGFTVYESFESAQVARSGVVPMPTSGEGVLGGHAVLIVGYDEASREFIVRNSWGEGWGVAGYCYMPIAYWTNPQLASDLWTIRMET